MSRENRYRHMNVRMTSNARGRWQPRNSLESDFRSVGSALTEDAVTESTAEKSLTQRQRVADIAWKIAAALLVAFLIYVLLHLDSSLIELQGG
jgi:hypothetical protein